MLGPVPPPFGGVAVFTQRLTRALRRRGLVARQLDPLAQARGGLAGRLRASLALLSAFFGAEQVLHDNVGPYYWRGLPGRLLYGFGLLASGKRVVVNVHQGRFPEVYASRGRLARATIRWLLRRVRLAICDNPRIRDFFVAEGVPPGKLAVLPSFVPFEEDATPLPDELEAFLAAHGPIVTVTGWTFSAVYNFDAVLRLVHRLRRSHPRLGLLLVVSRFVQDPGYRDSVLALMRELELEADVATVSDLPDVLPVYRRSDVLLRSTSSDGSSLSVMEALYVGTPVVASDCAERPPGTRLFPTGDWERAYDTLAAVLADGKRPGEQPWVRREAERVLDEIVRAYEGVSA